MESIVPGRAPIIATYEASSSARTGSGCAAAAPAQSRRVARAPRRDVFMGGSLAWPTDASAVPFWTQMASGGDLSTDGIDARTPPVRGGASGGGVWCLETTPEGA